MERKLFYVTLIRNKPFYYNKLSFDWKKIATYNITQDNQTKMSHNKHEVIRPGSSHLFNTD